MTQLIPIATQRQANRRLPDEQCITAYEDLLTADPAWLRTPDSLSGLAAPRDTVTSATTDAALASKEHATKDSLSWHRRCARFLIAAAVSNNTYSMLGNIIITSHLPIGSYLQLGCAALAVWNEMREREHATVPVVRLAEAPWKRAIPTLVWSPGIYRYCLFAVFCANACEEGFQRGVGLGTAFLLLAIGNLCVGHELNGTYFARLRAGSHASDAQTTSRPRSSVRELLSSGVLYWGMADVLVGMRGMHQMGENIFSAPPLFALGVGCAIASVLSAYILGKQAQRTVIPFGLNALTNYLFAVANYAYVPGAQALAVSIGLWGTGSGMIALGKIRARAQEKTA